jgi:site-specific DNA recombinase
MIEAPARLARRGVETKLVIEAGGADPAPDPALLKAVARSHAWFEDLATGRAESVRAIARREGVTPRYVSRLLELAFLPPKLVEAILADTQPADVTAESLTRGERGLVWEKA